MKPTVSVCVCTFRRPSLLGGLLDALAGEVVGAVDAEVVVVDNDAAASARSALDQARRRWPSLVLRDFVEPRQNIARARNLAVQQARAPWIAFIDDDEVPAAGWLGRLGETARRFGADGVLGPVVPRLPPETPPWIARGRFFDRPRHATGRAVPPAELRTGNLLVRRALLVDGERGRFDPAFGLSGGEDSVLLAALARRGARFVWCDEAAVFEAVPVDRATPRWLLRRAYGGGHGHARHLLRERGLRALPALLARGTGALGLGAGLGVPALALGEARREVAVRWLCVGAAGLGKLAALGPSRFEAYRAA